MKQVKLGREPESPRISGRLQDLGACSHEHTDKVLPEVRERAVRMVDHEHDDSSQWATSQSVAQKIGYMPETLSPWVRSQARDEDRGSGPISDDRARLKELERENRELRLANEILRKASTYFALAELDRRRRDLG